MKCKGKVKKGKCRVSAERQVQTGNPLRTQTRSVVTTTCGLAQGTPGHWRGLPPQWVPAREDRCFSTLHFWTSTFGHVVVAYLMALVAFGIPFSMLPRCFVHPFFEHEFQWILHRFQDGFCLFFNAFLMKSLFVHATC